MKKKRKSNKCSEARAPLAISAWESREGGANSPNLIPATIISGKYKTEVDLHTSIGSSDVAITILGLPERQQDFAGK